MESAKSSMNCGTISSPQTWVIGVHEGKGWRKGQEKIFEEIRSKMYLNLKLVNKSKKLIKPQE